MTVYFRFIVRRVVEYFGLMFFSCALLYILLDYSSRLGMFQKWGISWATLGWYYGLMVCKRVEIFFPISLLLSVSIVLHGMYRINVWAALMSGGLRWGHIWRPFWFVAGLSFLCLLAHEQWVYPRVLRSLEQLALQADHAGSSVSSQVRMVKSFDGISLLYSSKDPLKKTLYDVWVLFSWDQVWHVETLDFSKDPPTGAYIDRVERDFAGKMVATQEVREQDLSHLGLSWNDIEARTFHPQEESITELINALFRYTMLYRHEYYEIEVALLKKLCFPLLGIFAVLFPLPVFFSFSRNHSMYKSYAFVIALFFIFYCAVTSLMILGSSGALHPIFTVVPLMFGVLVMSVLALRWKVL